MKPRTTLSLLACILIAGCANDQDIDKSTQYGPSPKLPQPARELLPRMNIAKVVGWASGETPTVPQGFRIEAIATGLSSPSRSGRPTTAACRTSGCSRSRLSTSAGETQMPPAFSMSLLRPRHV